MFELQVKDFQSIKDATIQVDGYTAIVGPSNIGKSAIFRAIDFLVYNRTGDWFIRKGCPRTEITLSLKDKEKEPVSIVWKKGVGTAAVYYLNEGDPVKAQTAFDLYPELGLLSLDVGTDKVKLQFSPQFNPLFLLNESPEPLFKLFSYLLGISGLNTCIKEVKEDISKYAAVLKDKEVSYNILVDKMSRCNYSSILLWIDSLLVSANSYKSLLQEISAIGEYYTRLENILKAEEFYTTLDSYVSTILDYDVDVEFLRYILDYLNSNAYLYDFCIKLETVPFLDINLDNAFDFYEFAEDYLMPLFEKDNIFNFYNYVVQLIENLDKTFYNFDLHLDLVEQASKEIEIFNRLQSIDFYTSFVKLLDSFVHDISTSDANYILLNYIARVGFIDTHTYVFLVDTFLTEMLTALNLNFELVDLFVSYVALDNQFMALNRIVNVLNNVITNITSLNDVELINLIQYFLDMQNNLSFTPYVQLVDNIDNRLSNFDTLYKDVDFKKWDSDFIKLASNLINIDNSLIKLDNDLKDCAIKLKSTDEELSIYDFCPLCDAPGFKDRIVK